MPDTPDWIKDMECSSCGRIMDCICCPTHGKDCKLTDSGSNSGFAGEGCAWADWECGHTEVSSGAYTDF
jgi:hypothetical protein